METKQTPPSDLTPPSFSARMKAFYERHEKYGPAAFFILGFVFDVVTLSRIDDWFTILQQLVYLAILSFLIVLEIRAMKVPMFIQGRSAKLWQYRELVIHFLFGSLLSVYTLFFFKSSSFENSFLFLIAMATVMVINEFEHFQRLGASMRFVLLSLCFTCFFSYVVPIILGFMGFLPFLLSMVIAGGVIYFLYWLLPRDARPLEGEKRILLPGLAVPVVFLILYVLQLIPPVPLSTQYMGIYHGVEKSEGRYQLTYERPWWKFWQSGAQTFLAQPGDRVYVFARVFAPVGFKDQIVVRWLYDDPRAGWKSSDAIPLSISGGRDEGFRGFAFKSNYQPGDWMVKLETTDGREISRVRFEVIPEEPTTPDERNFHTDLF